MSEVVVLLVGSDSLPGRLEEVLLEKGMFVESCAVEQASGTLLVSSPDVVITSSDHLDEVARSVRAAGDSSEMSLLVMAPRGAVSKLRRSLPREVTAVLPNDLPPAAVAVRVKTVIKKSGKAKPSSVARSASAFDKTLAATPKAAQAQAAKAEPRPVTSGEDESIPAVLRAPKKRQVTRPGMSAPAQPSPLVSPPAAAALTKGRIALPETISDAPPVSRRVSLHVPATALPCLRIAIVDEDVTRADALASALRKSGHEVFPVSSRTGRERWHLLRKFAPQAIIVDEAGLSQDGGAWIGAFRADRFLRATPLVAASLESLFDEEEGEAVVSALTPQLDGLGRAEVKLLTALAPGQEIEVSPAQISPARLLSLVADQGVSATIEVKVREETLFWNIVSGSADTAELTVHGKSVDMGALEALDWILARKNAEVLVRTSMGLKLRDGVLVVELLRAAYRTHLPPEAAFRAPGALARGVSTLAPRTDARESEPPDSELPTRPVSLSQIPGLPALLQSESEAPGASASVDLPLANPPSNGQLPFQSRSVEPEEIDDAIVEVENTPAALVRDSVPPSSSKRNTPPGFVSVVKEKSSESPGRAVRWAGATAAAALLVGGTFWALSGGGEAKVGAQPAEEERAQVEIADVGSEPTSLPEGKVPAAEPKGEHESAPEEEAKASTGDELWRVKNVKKMDDCDVLLERPLDYYTSRPEWEGEKIWKRARHQLLIGEHEAANRLMCQAAFIDPDGRASVGLGEYYLAHRALPTAKEWAQYGIEQRPDNTRKSRELLGDVLSQMGEPEKAKEQWLETMKLEADDLPKIRTVAKTLTRLGHTARRGGDAPLAERLFRRAATLDGDNGEAAGGLASALLKNGEPELAERWARRALSLDASSGDALLVLGDIARDKGDIQGARREYLDIKEGTSAFKAAQDRLEAL